MLELDRGRGIPYKGNYSAFLEAKQIRLAQEEAKQSDRKRILARELEWAKASPAARTVKSKARLANYEKLLAEVQGYDAADEGIEFKLPPGPPLGNRVLEIRDVRKAFGKRVLFDHVTFELPRGGIVGVIGENGAGKTTLAKIMMGAEPPDSGEVRLGESALVAYVDQTRETLNGEKTVWEEVSGGNEWIQYGKKSMPSRAYLARFNFRGQDQQKKVKDLSGGERNRLQMAKLLKKVANLVLLDEPTNDLDLDTLRILEEAVASFAGCMVIITHDRWFLDRVATHILAFEGDDENGVGKVKWFEGNYASYHARLEEERRAAGKGPESGRGKYRKLQAP